MDVESSTFSNKINKSCPDVLGLSALLTTTLVEMKNTVEAVGGAGVTSKLKILLGGNSARKKFERDRDRCNQASLAKRAYVAKMRENAGSRALRGRRKASGETWNESM